MWKKKGTPFNPLDDSPNTRIVSEPGTGKSVLLDMLVKEEVIRRGISYEDAYKTMNADVDTDDGDSAESITSTDPT